MNDRELTDRLDRLQQEVTQLREFSMMQLAVIQVMAIKMGLTQDQYDALSPRPVPTPFDLMDMLKPKS